MKNVHISLLLERRLSTQQTRYKMRSYLIKDKVIDKPLTIALHLKHLRHKLETSGELTSVAANFHMAGRLSNPMCDDTNSTRAKRRRLYLNEKWLKWAEFFSHKFFRSHVIFWQVFVCVALLFWSMQAFENRRHDIIFFFHHYKHTRIRIRTRKRNEYGIQSLVIVERGPYAHVISIDNYIELNDEMAAKLNGDWFIEERYKLYCCHLLAGAILIGGRKGIIINCIEAYGRTPSTDAHYERFLYGKNAAPTTLPTPSTSTKYDDVIVVKKTKDNSTKLIVSTKSMNALVTSSLRIDMEVEPDIGSSTMEFTQSLNTRIFIENSQINAAQKALDDDEVKYLYNHNMLSQLRQARSKFNDESTYETLRSSSQLTNNHCIKPYTIWTLFDFDDNTASSSGPKMGSRLFQIIARYHLNNKLVAVVLFLSSIK